MKYLLLILFTSIVFCQNTITIYIDINSSKFDKFEKELIENIIKLKDKKEKTNTRLNFIELNSFQEIFLITDTNEKNDLKHTSLIINQISYSTSRALKYEFSKPYIFNFYSVMNLKEDAIIKLESLEKKYVYGVAKSSVYEEILKKLGFKYKLYDNAITTYDALKTKEIDFMFSDYLDSWVLEVKSVYLYEENNIDKICIMYPKGSTLKSDIDSTLEYYLKSPSYFNLIKKHFGQDAAAIFTKSSKSHN